MLAPAITRENAREMQARAVLARKRNQAIAKQAEEIAEASVAQPEQSAYANKLAYAQDKLLNELLTAESAKDKAALSQALKNLRETYHMATGAPKPGTIKPERQSSRQSVKQPSEPKLDTTDSVPPA